MSLSKHKYMPTCDFPEEILSEIFKRLPVKYVLRCRCVQKSWYHLIETPMFISLHSNYQKITAHINPKYLLFHNLDTHELTVRSDDAQCQEYCSGALDLQSAGQWYAQSNGLICVSNMFDPEHHYNPKIALWNPLVKKVKRIPDSPLSKFAFGESKWEALAFGFLPEVNDYVVVHIVKPELTAGPDEYEFDPYRLDNPCEQYSHSVMIGIYSLNTNSWKKISQDNVFVDYMSTNESVFVNSTAFWVGWNYYDLNNPSVMFFDTKTNILQLVPAPEWIALPERQLENPRILPFGQSIAYFVEVEDFDAEEDDEDYRSPHLDIFVLIDEFSWEQRMSVRLSENVSVRILGIRNNGEPVLAKLNSMISYDLDTHELYDFVDSCDHLTPYSCYEEAPRPPFDVRPFVETLVLLDIGLNTRTKC